MKKQLIYKFMFLILLITIPFNMVVINMGSNLYLSTLVIFTEILFLIIMTKANFLKNLEIKIILIFSVLMVTSTLFNLIVDSGENINTQILFIIIYFQSLFVFFMVYIFLEHMDNDFILKMLLLIILITAVRLIFSESENIFKFSTISGERINPAFAGGVNNFAILLGIGFLITIYKIKNIFFKNILMIFLFLLLLITMSRGAIFSLILTIMILFIVGSRRYTKIIVIFSISITIISLIILNYLGLSEFIFEQLNERIIKIFQSKENVISSSSGRDIILEDLFYNHIHKMTYYEILFGKGFGSINYMLDSGYYDSSHNIYIDIFYRNGVLIFIFYIVLLAIILFRYIANKNYKHEVLLSIFVFLQISILVNPFIYSVQVGWLYALFIAILLKNLNVREFKNDTANK